MRDTDGNGGGNGGGGDGGGDGGTPQMVLLAINQTYWLSQGKEYLNQMLRGAGFYPRPVRCIRFADHMELRLYLGPGRKITDFWGINPDIVDRMRRNDELDEVTFDTLPDMDDGTGGDTDGGGRDRGPGGA